MENKLPTIKEIAKRLNVSVSTVSRALKDHPRIGISTKEKVQMLAKELGYEPNTQAIFFKQKRTFIIGVILPYIREEFFSQAISGIEEAALKNNYTILFGQSYDDVEKEKKVVEAMKNQRVDGIIISLSKSTGKIDHLKALEKYNIPVVYFDRVPQTSNINKVYVNIFKATVEMVKHLYKMGCKRIALINGPDNITASKERLNGYIEATSAQKLKVDMQLVEKTDFAKASTELAMEKLLSLKKPAQAIISFNDYVHMDAVQYAKQHNIKVNQDVIFASYANLSITNYTAFPPILSIEQYPYLQGEKAMEVLMHLIDIKSAEEPKEELPFIAEEVLATLIEH